MSTVLQKLIPAFFQNFCVVLLGFEPRKAESKSAVLPLHHRTMFQPKFGTAKVELILKSENWIFDVFNTS